MIENAETGENTGFEPQILAFVCNWCAYGATESAGVNKMKYPANIKIVKVMLC